MTVPEMLAKLGTPQPVQAGSNPNGRFVLVEARSAERVARVMVEANCSADKAARAVAAALAVLTEGR